MSPQKAYDAAVVAAEAEHQTRLAEAREAFATFSAAHPEYENVRQVCADLVALADRAYNHALAAAAAVLARSPR
jgi:hypothetical protein